MKKFFTLLIALLLVASPAMAFQCQNSQSPDESDACFVQVRLADDETTLVSAGRVLVYDFVSNDSDTDLAASNVRIPTASANGVFVAGVAQGTLVSGSTAWILVRGKSPLLVPAGANITSSGAVFVAASGDASNVTSDTQNQLGFALEAQTGTTGTAPNEIEAFITIV